jgi:DNA-binding MarR family transcriptional regulator
VLNSSRYRKEKRKRGGMTRNEEEAKREWEDGTNAGLAGREWGEEGYAAWLDVFQANTLVARALERGLKEWFELPLAGHEVLVRLAEVPEGERLQMQELARRVHLSKSGLSQLFTRLERRGLVARRGDPENLRVTYAILTGEGREVLERALPAFREEIEERFAGHLDREEIRTLRRAMRKVIRASGEEPLSDEPDDA